MTWKITQGSLIGPHHRKNGEPNQDAYLAVEMDGVVILGVADGAGSLSQSHIGARLAVETAVGFVQIHLAKMGMEELVRGALADAREVLLAHEDNHVIGATLSLAIANETEWALGVVGDSYVLLHTADGAHTVYSEAPISEYANITRLLTSSDYEPVIASGTNELLGLSVASDGIETFSLRHGSALVGFWDPIAQRVKKNSIDLEALFSFLDSQDKIVDDTTLVTAMRG